MKKSRVKPLAAVVFVLLAAAGLCVRLASARPAASIFVVNSTGDAPDADLGDGLCATALVVECTLRAAIQQANADASADTIDFAIPGATDTGCAGALGVCTISPATPLPPVTQPATIDGYTQPGATQNSLNVGFNGNLRVKLNGAGAGAAADGLQITAGATTVRGLIINRFQGDGIELSTAGGNTISGNFIGTNSAGTSAGPGNGTASGNNAGVQITGGSTNVVGGSTPQARNVVSGNIGDGVRLTGAASGTSVLGSYIGTDKGGTLDVGNTASGVSAATSSNQIGDATTTPGQAAGNVISGNDTHGVLVTGAGANEVQGNLIGLQSSGAAARANSADGVNVNGASAGNVIGGAAPGFRNVISANADDGVELNGAGVTGTLIAANRIGTNASGTRGTLDPDLGNGDDGVLINGGAQTTTVGGLTSSPGSSPGNLISDNGSDGVEINGSGSSGNVLQGNLVGLKSNGIELLRNGSNGVLILGAPSNIVGGSTDTARNVITGGSGNGNDCVDIQGDASDGNTIAGNYLGTDINGGGDNTLTASDFGAGGDGVRVTSSADNNVIGGSASAAGTAPGNVIAGNNSDGVEVTGNNTTGNLVQGNLIGLKAGGAETYANGANGVLVTGSATGNTVGGSTTTPGTGLGNVIAGNNSDGVELSSADSNLVIGNLVGLQPGGTTPAGNLGHGVLIGANTNTVGGTVAGAGNTIAFNGGDGVFVSSGTGNAIRQNSIYSNTGLGIDLGPDGVTPNDTDDPDTGANTLQNFPILTDARTGSTIVQGTLNSTPSTTFTLDFFSSAMPDPTAFGEGQTFLESRTVTTDAGGDATFNFTLAASAPLGHVITATATNPTGNTSEFSNTFIVLAPTLARLREFGATLSDDGVVLEWRTGLEVDNLGFRLYREEEGGERMPITPSLVAGSALAVGQGTVLSAGGSYTWLDPTGTPASRYLLEDVDTAGRTTLHGPFWPTAGAGRTRRARQSRSPLLEQVGGPQGATVEQRGWAAQPAAEGQTEAVATHEAAPGRDGDTQPAVVSGGAPVEDPARQREIAAGPAVKLSVRRPGWYRVPRAALEAAGLSTSADPARLQLFADGLELAIRVDTTAWKQNGAVEFYGEGLDRPATDTRVYWLIEGRRQGRRISNTPAGSGGPDAPSGFDYTVERRDRSLYFSSLLNGERENFFGSVVTTTAPAQTISLVGLKPSDAGTARLEVAVQGVTAGPHVVRVTLNGSEVGTLGSDGREHKAAVFTVASSLLREGTNEVGLTSGAPSDVSLTDYVRVTYTRAYRAEGDRLSFTAAGGTKVRVTGFTTPSVRVVDVTEPSAATEIPLTVKPAGADEGGGYAVTLQPGGTGRRTLLAFGAGALAAVDEARANRPSTWYSTRSKADLVVITHADFREAASSLAARRTSEGLVVQVVDVEDLYDEFSFGAHAPEAVRGFLDAARGWRLPPRYVLLVGDGSYDPRNYTGRGSSDFVPARLIDTANMETASDEWLADFDGDGLGEMSVGRLPVRTADEAARLVSKIMGHVPGAAARRLLLVSDRQGADGFDFEAATASLLAHVPAGYETVLVNRGARDPETVRGEIIAGVNTGPLVVNYVGHGSVDVWTGDGLLRSEDALALTNGSRLPLFVMMTCLNGYYQDPWLDSLSESLLKAETGGAVAAWTSSGMTEPDGQTEMNRALYRALFESTGALRLGDALRSARAATTDPDVRRTWVLIGDPTTPWR